jgi:hypothetical protein
MVPVVAGPEAGFDRGDEPAAARPPRRSSAIGGAAGGIAADLGGGRGIRPGEAIAEARQAIRANPEGARECRAARPCGHAAGPGPRAGRLSGPGAGPGVSDQNRSARALRTPRGCLTESRVDRDEWLRRSERSALVG